MDCARPLPIRSGVTNTLIWFFIELVTLWAIDCALVRIHNHHVTKAIESGKKIQIQESKIPLVGTGLLAHGMQSKLFIFLRTALFVSFMLMNLGIDGTRKGVYKMKTLHSQLELRSVADGNKGESSYDRPYAQMNNRVLIKCIKVSDDEKRFTVFKPVFNLTNATTGASVSALIVQREGSVCLDGISARENETFISGELLADGPDVEPMKDGAPFRIKTDKRTLGIDIMQAGDLARITEVTTMDKKPLNGNASLVTGYCSPRQRSEVIGSEEQGQAMNCMFIFEQHGLAVFSVKNSWLNNLWALPKGSSGMRLGTRASAIRMNLNVSLSKEVHVDIAQRLLIAEASFQVVPMIATILKYHYSATMDRKC